jgi:hypothetical protein
LFRKVIGQGDKTGVKLAKEVMYASQLCDSVPTLIY